MFKNNKTADYQKLCKKLGYQFKNKQLLITALTRKAALLEGKQLSTVDTYQRLEFLGDKVIDLVIGEILYEQYPD